MLIHHLPIIQKLANFLTQKAASVVRPRDPSLPKDVVSVKTISKKAIHQTSKPSDPRAVKRPRDQDLPEDEDDPQIDIKV